MKSIREIEQDVALFFLQKYNVDFSDVVIMDIPCFWSDKEARFHDKHPSNKFFKDIPFCATYKYETSEKDNITKQVLPKTYHWERLRVHHKKQKMKSV